MSQERTSPDPAELTRHVYASLNRRDLGAIMGCIGSDSVLDASQWGLGIHTGPKAIRGFLDGWYGRLAELGVRVVEMQDFSRGVIFVVHKAHRAKAEHASLELEAAPVYQWVEHTLARVTAYTDVDEGRAAAERLAEERG
jgi:hypothetical protein